MQDAVGIDVQGVDAIEEQVPEGLQPVQDLLIAFPVMDQRQGGHATGQVLRGVVPVLGCQNDVDDIQYVVAKAMTNIIAFSLEGLWMYTLSMPIPSFMSLNPCSI